MEAVSRVKTSSKEKHSLTTLGLFFLCFLLGLYLGRAASVSRMAEVSPELRQYLQGYVLPLVMRLIYKEH